jgi:hypothetical protein
MPFRDKVCGIVATFRSYGIPATLTLFFVKEETMKKGLQIFCLLGVVLYGTYASGSTLEERVNALEEIVRKQSQTIKEQQEVINKLQQPKEAKPKVEEKVVEEAKPAEETKPVEEAKTAEEAKPAGGVLGLFGGSYMTNPYISLVLDTYYYNSSLSNGELQSSGIPGFTTIGLDREHGFNLREVELFMFAPVDPYFNLYANLPIEGNDGITIEEAYAVTTDLPAGFQIKGGRFKSNFSRLDAQHPHAWDFFDIALPYRAFMGDEGLGGENGVQLTYLPPFPVYTLLGAEILQGENDLLFGKNARSGPHAFTFFAKNSFDMEDSTLYYGPYVLFGQTKNNNVAPDAEVRGHSTLAGIEAVWKWKPSTMQSVILQSEYMYLLQNGNLQGLDASGNPTGTIDSLQRRQDGFYIQALYQWYRWRVGARYDMLGLFSDTFKQAGISQSLGNTPWRATASLEFNPSEFTRIRLQYTHDRSNRDGRTNDEGIVQFLFGIGAHAAHTF